MLSCSSIVWLFGNAPMWKFVSQNWKTNCFWLVIILKVHLLYSYLRYNVQDKMMTEVLGKISEVLHGYMAAYVFELLYKDHVGLLFFSRKGSREQF